MDPRGFVLTFGVFESFYHKNLLRAHSPSEIAWIGTVQVFCLSFVGVLTGPIYDLGYHDLLLYVSSFMFMFGVMMLSLSTTFYQILLSQGVCIGIGSGILYVPSLTLVVTSFTTKRALATTLCTAGSSVGEHHLHSSRPVQCSFKLQVASCMLWYFVTCWSHSDSPGLSEAWAS